MLWRLSVPNQKIIPGALFYKLRMIVCFKFNVVIFNFICEHSNSIKMVLTIPLFQLSILRALPYKIWNYFLIHFEWETSISSAYEAYDIDHAPSGVSGHANITSCWFVTLKNFMIASLHGIKTTSIENVGRNPL